MRSTLPMWKSFLLRLGLKWKSPTARLSAWWQETRHRKRRLQPASLRESIVPQIDSLEPLMMLTADLNSGHMPLGSSKMNVRLTTECGLSVGLLGHFFLLACHLFLLCCFLFGGFFLSPGWPLGRLFGKHVDRSLERQLFRRQAFR